MYLLLTQLHVFVPDTISSHSPPSTDSRRVVVSYKRKYVHKVLINHLLKFAEEKVRLGELTFLLFVTFLTMTIAVDWDVEHLTKQINKQIQ